MLVYAKQVRDLTLVEKRKNTKKHPYQLQESKNKQNTPKDLHRHRGEPPDSPRAGNMGHDAQTARTSVQNFNPY